MCTRLTQITIDKKMTKTQRLKMAVELPVAAIIQKKGDVLVYPDINVYIDMQSQRSFFRAFSICLP